MNIHKLLYSTIFSVAMLISGCGTTHPIHTSETDTITPQLPKIDITPLPAELEARDLYYEGLRAMLLKSSTNEQIEKLFDSARVKGFDEAILWLKKAELHIDSAQLAEQYARKAIEKDSTDIQAYYLLCDMLLKTQQIDEAIDILTRAKKLAPDNIAIYTHLAGLYRQKGLPYAALNELNEAQTKFGDKENLLQFKRELMFQMQLYDKAIEEAENLAEKSPYNVENLIFLGKMYSARRNIKSDSLALKAFNSALEIEPENVSALASLSSHYASREDYANFLRTTRKLFQSKIVPAKNKVRFFNEGIKMKKFYSSNYYLINDLVNTLVATHPEDSAVKIVYTDHLIASGFPEQAIEYQKKWLAENPNQEISYEYIISGELFLNRPDSALLYINRSIKQFPDNVDFATKKAMYYYSIGKKREALKEWKKILKIAKDDSTRCNIYGSLGDLTSEIEDLKNRDKIAYGYYEKALAIDSMNISVLNNYSYKLSSDSTQIDKALMLARRMMQQDVSNPTFLDTYAWILFKAGHTEEALKVMRQAILLDTTNSEVLLLHYGDILFESGQKYLARIYWRKALEAGADGKEIEIRIKKLEQ